MIVVFAVLGVELNVTGLEHEVPTAGEPELAEVKPLSVTSKPFVTVTALPISAWYVVKDTTILAANTTAIIHSTVFVPRKRETLSRLRLQTRNALFTFCLKAVVRLDNFL